MAFSTVKLSLMLIPAFEPGNVLPELILDDPFGSALALKALAIALSVDVQLDGSRLTCSLLGGGCLRTCR